MFGSRVRKLVEEVTDDTSLPSRERKQKQIIKAPLSSSGAQQIKLADKISNLRDIFDEPPRGWSMERQATYYKWAREVVDGIRGVNPQLERCFDEIFRRFFNERCPTYLEQS